MAQLCLPVGLNVTELKQLDSLIQKHRLIQKGRFIYRTGDSFTHLYAIRSGSVKAYTLTSDGQIQMTDFFLLGEIMGLDAIATKRYHSNAVALQTTSICEIPFHQLEQLSLKIPALQQQLFRLMSQEITSEQNLVTWLGRKNAEQRLAAFLLNLSNRYHQRGFSATEFHLSMSRTDIANYLGLAVETVSRILSKLSEQKTIAIDKKFIRILDMDCLHQIVNVGKHDSLPCIAHHA